MNLYFLVEGRSEFNIYPKWLSHLLPCFKRVNEYDQITDNNYFIFNAAGQPEIIDEHLPNAIKDINLLKFEGKYSYSYLLVCLDAEELTPDELRTDILTSVQSHKDINLSGIELVLIIQNRCIETWLLGNQNFILTQLANIPIKYSEPFLTYRNYYDVRNQDPELMGIYNGSKSITHAQFHEEYLKSVFKARELSYAKGKSKEVGEKFYLDELIKRVNSKPAHLQSFQYFLSVMKSLE